MNSRKKQPTFEEQHTFEIQWKYLMQWAFLLMFLALCYGIWHVATRPLPHDLEKVALSQGMADYLRVANR